MQTFYDKYVKTTSSNGFTDLSSNMGSTTESTSSTTSSADSLLGMLDRRARKSSFDPNAPHRKTAQIVQKQVHEVLTSEDRLKAMFDECYLESKARIDAEWNERCSKSSLLVKKNKKSHQSVDIDADVGVGVPVPLLPAHDEKVVVPAADDPAATSSVVKVTAVTTRKPTDSPPPTTITGTTTTPRPFLPVAETPVGISPVPSFHSCVSQQYVNNLDGVDMVRVQATTRSQSLPVSDFQSPSAAAFAHDEALAAQGHADPFFVVGDIQQAEPAQLIDDEREEQQHLGGSGSADSVRRLIANIDETLSSTPQPLSTRLTVNTAPFGGSATPKMRTPAPDSGVSGTKSVFSPTPARLAALQHSGVAYDTSQSKFTNVLCDNQLISPSVQQQPAMLLHGSIIAEHSAAPLLLSAAKNKASPFSVRNINELSSRKGGWTQQTKSSTPNHCVQPAGSRQTAGGRSAVPKKPTPTVSSIVAAAADPFALPPPFGQEDENQVFFSPTTHEKVHSMMHHPSSSATSNADLNFSACWDAPVQQVAEPLDRVLTF